MRPTPDLSYDYRVRHKKGEHDKWEEDEENGTAINTHSDLHGETSISSQWRHSYWGSGLYW